MILELHECLYITAVHFHVWTGWSYCNLALVTVVCPHISSQSCQFTKANRPPGLARYVLVATQSGYENILTVFCLSLQSQLDLFLWIAAMCFALVWECWLLSEDVFWSRYDIPSVLLLLGTYCPLMEIAGCSLIVALSLSLFFFPLLTTLLLNHNASNSLLIFLF